MSVRSRMVRHLGQVGAGRVWLMHCVMRLAAGRVRVLNHCVRVVAAADTNLFFPHFHNNCCCNSVIAQWVKNVKIVQ